MFWAVAVEWHFYLIFPFILKQFNKSGCRYLLGVIFIFIIIRLSIYLLAGSIRDVAYMSIFGRMDQFLIGMLLGAYYKTEYRAGPKWDVSLVVVLLGLFALLLFLNGQGGWPSNKPFKIMWSTIEGSLWGIFILSYLSASRYIPGVISFAIASIGTISYSMYLIHFIVIEIFIKNEWLISWSDMSSNRSALLNTPLLIIPVVLTVSCLTFHIVEKPFLNMRGKYKN
jgi:peptidoglycan/LPS O-acetylase OafA/YrhL